MAKFSLIVATIGRREELANLLESLTRQTERDFEVIIVDQNPEGFLSGVVRRYLPELKLTHLRINRAGASRARNVGLDSAVGEIVAFPDDDCEFPADLLTRVGDVLQAFPDLAGLTASSKDKWSDASIARFSEQGGSITRFNILKRCIEFGIFLRREALNGHRFDESMGVGAESPWWSDEGPDLLLSVMSAGHTVRYFPEIVIFHPDPIRNYDEKAIVRSFRYGRGRGHYLRKHSYPLWFVCHVWGLYVVGIFLGLAELNFKKAKYYYSGLKGRVAGYFDRSRAAL